MELVSTNGPVSSGSAHAQLARVDAVRECLARHTQGGDRMLVAVSGGADSMGLLALLTDELRVPERRLVAGHVNHGIRADGDADIEVIHGVAGPRGVPVLVRRGSAVELARTQKMSLEAAARDLRYRLLREMADEAGCNWVLTAHTVDDSAETVLMRMLSGAPWYEWTAIPEVRDRILRPLLGVSRQELRAWVGARRLPFREDETNADLRLGRNRLRARLATKPEFWTSETVRRLVGAGRDLAKAVHWQRRVARALVMGRIEEARAGVCGLEIDDILPYFERLVFVPVEVAWSELIGASSARLPSRDRRRVAQFVSGTTPEACLTLPCGVTVVRRGRRVWLTRGLPAEISCPVSFGEWLVPERGAVLRIERGAGAARVAGRGVAVARMDARFAGRPLWLRSWRPGERMKPVGRPAKKIADLLWERGTDPVERASALVLADEEGPLWLVGGPLAERAVPGEDTVVESIWVTWDVHDERFGNRNA